MSFLRIGQSEFVLRHVFATLRSFIHKVRTSYIQSFELFFLPCAFFIVVPVI